MIAAAIIPEGERETSQYGKSYNSRTNRAGFTLIELLMVIVIVGILAAVAVPAYIGAREKSRKSELSYAARAAEADMIHWLSSAVKGTFIMNTEALRREIDTNWDGAVNAPGDCTNNGLFSLGASAADAVALAYANARSNVPNCNAAAHMVGGAETSPWNGMAGCNAAVMTLFVYNAAPAAVGAAGTQCQIQLSPNTPNTVQITATDNGPGGGGGAGQLISQVVIAAE